MSKVRKQFILDAGKICRAKKILGCATDTEAVSEALDIVIANAEITRIHKKLAGHCRIRNMDQSKFNA